MKNFKLSVDDRTLECIEREGIEHTHFSDGYITVKDEMLPEELFDMGLSFGRQIEKGIQEQPETFNLPEKYAKILQEAKDEYQQDQYIQFTSLKISKPFGNGMCEITFEPTQAIHMFGLISRYGKMCAAAQKETV